MLIYAVDALVQPCWGSPRSDETLRVNPLALIEPIFLFAKLSSLIYHESPQKPLSIAYQVSFRRLMNADKFAFLAEGPLDKLFFSNGHSHSASQSDLDRAIVWPQGDVDPEAVAYQLVQEIYHWFGIEDPRIPYTKKNERDESVIDPEQLVAAGK